MAGVNLRCVAFSVFDLEYDSRCGLQDRLNDAVYFPARIKPEADAVTYFQRGPRTGFGERFVGDAFTICHE